MTRMSKVGVSQLILEAADRRIEALKQALGIGRKVYVLRAGMTLLEKEAKRIERVKRWKRGAALVNATSREVNRGFQGHSRMKRI